MAHLTESYQEIQHPRVRKGRPHGGEWADKFGNPKLEIGKYAIKKILPNNHNHKESRLSKVIDTFLKMPYFRNFAARSGKLRYNHETAVAEVLKTGGFQEIKPDKFRLTKKVFNHWMDEDDDSEIQELLKDMPNGSFIPQPMGTQCFPDFIVKDDKGNLIPFECKSSYRKFPTWNDNMPRQKAIYIFTSSVTDETTLYMGRDVIPKEVAKLINEQKEHYLKVVRFFNDKIKQLDTTHRGWIFRLRPQTSQRGGMTYTDYFNHRDRKICEENVKTYIKNLGYPNRK